MAKCASAIWIVCCMIFWCSLEKFTRKPPVPCENVRFKEVSALWCVPLREIPMYFAPEVSALDRFYCMLNFLIVSKTLSRHPWQYFDEIANSQDISIVTFMFCDNFDIENSKNLQLRNLAATIPVTKFLCAHSHYLTSSVVSPHSLQCLFCFITI